MQMRFSHDFYLQQLKKRMGQVPEPLSLLKLYIGLFVTEGIELSTIIISQAAEYAPNPVLISYNDNISCLNLFNNQRLY